MVDIPSKAYVVFTEEPLEPSGKRYLRIEIPPGYENSELGAKKYFFNELNRDAVIIACIPAEMYNETDDPPNKRKLVEDIKISFGKFYEEDLNNISDSELLSIIEKLQQDYLRYASALMKVTEITRNLTFWNTKP